MIQCIKMFVLLCLLAPGLTACSSDDAAKKSKSEIPVAEIGDPGTEEFLPDPDAPAYYIDEKNGNDENDGRSAAKAWKTLKKIHSVQLVPGDVVRLARGSVWTGESLLFDNGSAGSETEPVIFEPYGEGDAPLITKPAALWDSSRNVSAVSIGPDCSYVYILDLAFSDTQELPAVQMDKDSHHILIAGNEIYNCGVGVSVCGTDQRVLSNHIHDIGASGKGGGIGIEFRGSAVEFAWNRIENCVVTEENGHRDGGAFEYYGRWFDYSSDPRVELFDVSDDVQIHHNVISDCLMFMEAYGNATNMVIAYNLYLDSPDDCIMFHFDDCEHDTWTHTCSYRVSIENNTFVPTLEAEPAGWGLIGLLVDYDHMPDVSENSVNLVNNIFVTNYKIITFGNPLAESLTHSSNMFVFSDNGAISNKADAYQTDSTDIVIDADNPGDPGFEDADKYDYRLRAGSPAIDMGIAATYQYDLMNNTVPAGSVPDIGAYEAD